MSFAPTYTPTTSFVNDETNQAAGRSTVRTIAVDAELANICSAINALKANLQKIQRDDDKLLDGVIEPYALAATTRAMLAARAGNAPRLWAPGIEFKVSDLVQNGSLAYICYTAHISPGAFNATGFWIALNTLDGSSVTAIAVAVAALEAKLDLKLSLSGGKMTGSVNFAAEILMTSASTTNIFAANSNTIRLNGSASITSFGAGTSGTTRLVIFNSVMTLVNDAAFLFLPTGLNITTASGDTAVFISLGGNISGCVSYQKSDGTSLKGGNDAELRGDLASITNVAKGTALITDIPSGTGAIARTQRSINREHVSVTDFGADSTGVADSTPMFILAANSSPFSRVVIPAGVWRLNTSPTSLSNVTWVINKGATFLGAGKLPAGYTSSIVSQGKYKSIASDTTFANGIFNYLELYAAQSLYGQIGSVSVVTSATGTGNAGEAFIGTAVLGINSKTSGASGVWGLYATMVHSAGATGYTHAMEVDVAHLGATVSLSPSNPFKSGLSAGLWLASGGEVTEPSAGGIALTSSAAIVILQNDSRATKQANFDKGILFHNKALSGADGTTGEATAIAYAPGHAMRWFNNSEQVTSQIISVTQNFANAVDLRFTDTNTLFADRNSGQPVVAFSKQSGATSYLNIYNSPGGQPVILAAQGSSTDIDLIIATKGAGRLQVNYSAVGATNAAAFSAVSRIAIKDGAGFILWVPCSITAW